jgi:hypothetical protein
MTSDDQNRILIIPWTPPSPHRRREIIQGEGNGPSATRPMTTETRAALTDALREAHHWLDELTKSPNQTIPVPGQRAFAHARVSDRAELSEHSRCRVPPCRLPSGLKRRRPG